MARCAKAIVFCVGMIAAVPGHAVDAVSTTDAKIKINLAGKQRMLSQRIARASCFKAVGVNVQRHDKILAAGLVEFDAFRIGLRSGSDDIGILPEDDEAVLAQLTDVDEVWQNFYGILTEPLSASRSYHRLNQMSVDALVHSNDVVVALEETYQDVLELPELARLINVSGRQRMLTQRAAKELCLIAAVPFENEYRESLKKTVQLFDRSLQALQIGDDEMGLIGAPTPELQFQLEYVAELWAPLREVFLAAAEGGTPSEEDLQYIADSIDEVLREANVAVQLYAAI